MSDRKSKLRSYKIIMPIIVIVLVLLIFILVFSLVLSATKGEESSDGQDSDETSEPVISEEDDKVTESSTTTTTHISVTATETAAEDETTEESTAPDVTEDIPETSAAASEQLNSAYSRSFFADDLFIGDSISTGLYLYDKLDMKNVAAAIGYTPYKAYTNAVDLYDGTSATALEYATSMQPKRIFIMLGSNGMGSSSDIETMKNTYRTLIDKLSANCPSSEIYCISVTPVAAGSSAAASAGITNEMIQDFNAYIKGMCADLNIGYFDLYTLLSDGSGYFSEEYAEADGLHFLGKTYNVMLSYIQDELS